MPKESIQKKKGRVRPPRVHITYDVELGGADVKKEIPFVMGVISDLSGNPKEKLPKLAERKFPTIDRDNFDAVLKSMQPRLQFRVDNKLQDDGSELSVELEFNKLADFAPDAVAKQVGPLNDLLEVRSKLKDLLSRAESDDRLEDLLGAILNDADARGKLTGTLGGGAGAAGGPAGAGDDSSKTEG
jgi:type VI secretion system protein ImpB